MPYWKSTRNAHLGEPWIDPTVAVFFLELSVEDYIIEEDARDKTSHDHELANKILGDRSGRLLLEMERQALKEVQSLFRGWRILTSDRFGDTLSLKVEATSLELARSFFDAYENKVNSEGVIYLDTPYYIVSNLTFHPQGGYNPVFGDNESAGTIKKWMRTYGR